MARPKSRTRRPQTLATEAQYLLNRRRVELWIPFLESKIAELEARIREKGAAAGQA